MEKLRIDLCRDGFNAGCYYHCYFCGDPWRVSIEDVLLIVKDESDEVVGECCPHCYYSDISERVRNKAREKENFLAEMLREMKGKIDDMKYFAIHLQNAEIEKINEEEIDQALEEIAN